MAPGHGSIGGQDGDLRADIKHYQDAANEFLRSIGLKIDDKKSRVEKICLSLQGKQATVLIDPSGEQHGPYFERCKAAKPTGEQHGPYCERCKTAKPTGEQHGPYCQQCKTAQPNFIDRDILTNLLIETGKNVKILKAELNCCHKALESSKLEADSLREELRQSKISHEDEVADLKGQLKSAQEDLKECRKQAESLASQVKSTTESLTAAQQMESKLKGQLNKLQKSYNELESKYSKLQADYQEVQKRLEERDQEVSSLKTALGECQKKCAEMTDLNRQVVEYQKQLEQHLEDATRKLNACTYELEREKAYSSSLKAKLKEAARHFLQWHGALERLSVDDVNEKALGIDDFNVDDARKKDGEVIMNVESACGSPNLRVVVQNLESLCQSLCKKCNLHREKREKKSIDPNEAESR